MRRSTVALLALAASLLCAPAAAQKEEPRVRGAQVEEVAALTGPEAPSDMRTPDICGTDIGTVAEWNDRLYIAFGDTFGFDGDDCPRFGPNWRSNVLAITSDLDPSDGIEIDEWYSDGDGGAIAVTEGAHQPAFAGEQTRIPTAMFAFEDSLYMHYMSVHGFSDQGGVWECNFSRFLSSQDGGESWQEASADFDGPNGNFGMLALSAQDAPGNEDGAFVYALGTPCGRFGATKAARAPAGDPFDLGAWEYYDGDGWTAEREQAVEVVPAPVGEGSLVWNEGLGRWLYSYLNEDTAAIELREASFPWGSWSEPVTLATAAEYPQPYGAYLSPALIDDDGATLYFVMSRFGPYNAYVMKAELDVSE